MSALEERFWVKVDIGDVNECWMWTGSISPDGYGRILIKRINSLAHRTVWEMYFGEIPDGLCVCHKCDVRACVNPSHLFLGTKLDNAHDMLQKGRSAMRFTKSQAEAIKKDTRPYKAIMSEYGISDTHIYQIRSGKRRSVF